MGYYTTLIDSNLLVKKEDFQSIYEKMCELNNYDELKRGGGFGQLEEQGESKWNPNKWFSWMPYNYPELYFTMQEVLEQVGFELSFNEDGDLINIAYYNKTGNEDYFLSCFAGYVKDGTFIEFKGEEDTDYYRYVFKDGKMILEEGIVSIKWEHSHTYEFGKMSAEDQKMAEWRIEWEAKHKANVADHVVGKGV
jgi:hypothetical protein